MSKKVYIGLMSGTSMDGIDVSAIEIDSHIITEIAHINLPYEDKFKLFARKIERLFQNSNGIVKENLTDDFEQELTQLHIEAVNQIISSYDLDEITAIGFHGQTVYHNPQEKLTIQLGDGELMANKTGIKVICDFRSNDVLNGGQGAPLAPIYHMALAQNSNLIPTAVINCGGISNITIIKDNIEDNLIAFDTGPGNILLDRYIRTQTNNQEFMDKDAKYASKGVVNNDILDLLFQKSIIQNGENYFDIKYPKSLCTSNIKLPDEIFKLSIYDACKTLAEFTAITIYNALEEFYIDNMNIVLVGGGWYNPAIINSLKEKLRNKQANFIDAEEFGSKIDSMESSAFAFLAYRTLNNLPISFPNTTGISTKMMGGKIYIPNFEYQVI